MRGLRQQRGGSHDLTGLAVSALRNFFGDPRGLQGVLAVGGQSLNGGYVLTRHLGHRRGTGTGGRPLYVYCASAAQSRATAKLCAGELESIAQNPEERSVLGDVDLALAPVNPKSDLCHGALSSRGRNSSW